MYTYDTIFNRVAEVTQENQLGLLRIQELEENLENQKLELKSRLGVQARALLEQELKDALQKFNFEMAKVQK